jgi:cobalt-zinc-cadmium efflux system outer membrane protein
MCKEVPDLLRKTRKSAALVWLLLLVISAAPAQEVVVDNTLPMHSTDKMTVPFPAKYLDPVQGKTADELVALALENNGEIAALRKEAEAAEALIRQARLRPNPSLELSGTKQIGGADNSRMVEGSLPLELGGRRAARIRVAERELEIRRLAVAERERQIAAEVRVKFGEVLANAYKLKFAEEMVILRTEHYNLVAATVQEGRRPPLEQNMETVELNRLRAMRETADGRTEIALLELRNIAGIEPQAPLRLKGDFENLLDFLPPLAEAAQNALRERPDLQGARAVEQLAGARIEQARSEGRIDADVMVGYQRMRSGFPLQGIDDAGNLRMIDSTFNFFTFGVKINLPVRNRNQGMIAAAVSEEDAARRRREFGELTVRREVTVAYTRFQSAARAMEIYRVGVREQAAANLQVVRQTYELGSKPLFDYINEHHRFIDIENGFIDAQLETYLARVEILRAASLPGLK